MQEGTGGGDGSDHFPFLSYDSENKLLHHISGMIENFAFPEYKEPRSVILSGIMEYSILEAYGRGNVFPVTMMIWLEIGALLFILIVACGIGIVRYMRVKNAYDIWYYQVETTNAMAHDLRTPLTAISGYAENLAEGIHEEKRDEYTNGIRSNIIYMNQMIDDILQFSKNEKINALLMKEEVKLRDFIDSECKNFQYIINERKLTVTIQGDSTITTDRQLFRSLVDNLLSNAVKYAKSGTEILIMIQNREFHIINELEGPVGKPVEELKKPYIKGDNSRSGKQGSGVGLAIVENAAAKLKYKVSYEINGERFEVRVRM